MGMARITLRAGVRFHRPRGPRRGVPPSLGVFWLVRGYGGPDANTVTCGMPVAVFLMTEVCGKRGRAF
jgi:hypothetical protein